MWACVARSVATVPWDKGRRQPWRVSLRAKQRFPISDATRARSLGYGGRRLPSHAVSSGPKMVALHTKRLSSLCGLALHPCTGRERQGGEGISIPGMWERVYLFRPPRICTGRDTAVFHSCVFV